jgi:hypothetical protein
LLVSGGGEEEVCFSFPLSDGSLSPLPLAVVDDDDDDDDDDEDRGGGGIEDVGGRYMGMSTLGRVEGFCSSSSFGAGPAPPSSATTTPPPLSLRCSWPD